MRKKVLVGIILTISIITFLGIVNGYSSRPKVEGIQSQVTTPTTPSITPIPSINPTNSPAPEQTFEPSPQIQNPSDCGTYTNSYGQIVPRPCNFDTPPVGATARCVDGTYSFSQHRRGTCSYHGGVAEWL